MDNTPNNTASAPDETPGLSYDMVKQIIASLYTLPEAGSNRLDFVSTADVQEAVRQISDTSTETIYLAMQEQGFETTNIEGILYWKVKVA